MKRNKVLALVEGAVMVALATVLSYIQVFRLPWGGAITLLSMLPIVLFSIRRGIKMGFIASFAYALIQFLQGVVVDGLFGWGLTVVALIACIILDYIFAFTILGIAGIFRNKGIVGWIGGIALAICLRFCSHLISGAAIFHSAGKIWEGFATENEWLYSAIYNGAYMLPELIFTVVAAILLLQLPQVKKIITVKD